MRGPMLSVTEARAVVENLREATQAADPNLLAPVDWIKRFTTVIRSIAPRDVQHRYRLDGFQGVTMGQLHRNVEALLREFDAMVDDNPRLRKQDTTSARE